MSKLFFLILIFYITIFRFFFISSKNLQYYEEIFLNEETNVTCPDNCKDGKCDNSTLKCDSCIDGYYLDNCSQVCPTINCLRCNQFSGECEECKNGLKLIDDFCCEQYCDKCNNTGCTECSDETKYGQNCTDCPSNCYYDKSSHNRKCDQNSGYCYSCISGNRGKKCEQKCSKGCNLTISNCDMNDGTCTCKKNYYGQKCDKKCDENCIKCNNISGICYQCKDGYYPIEKKCNTCPENCEGECPGGICIKCKKGFYGDICNETCSIFCINNICDKEDGLCDCINYFWKETHCTECINHFDKSTNCTDCIVHFDIKSMCKDCIDYFDKETNCTECINNFDKETNCAECINHFDLKSKCTECKDYFDIETNCTECINYFDKKTNCTECINHFDLESKCTECINYFDKNTNCSECINYFDKETDCTKCINYFDINTNCSECINHFDIKSNCAKCLYHFDDKTNCSTCINFYDINTNCTECINHFDAKKDCSVCEKNFNITSNCTECIDFFDIETNCTDCINFFDIQTDCTECITNYNISTQCLTCINKYNISDNCTTCLDYYDIDTSCQNCMKNFDPESECKYCLKNYNISNKCLTCINHFELETNCTNCSIGFYGENCTENCYEGCDLSVANCRKDDGYCEKCLHPFFGEKCENKSDIANCTSIDKKTGDCLKCQETYYLIDNKCEPCSTNCTNSSCKDDTGECYECASINNYGEKCEKTCSPFCNGSYIPICNRINGSCHCSSDHFSDDQCTECKDGYYNSSEGCIRECSYNCKEGEICNKDNGHCNNCKYGFWDDKCDSICDKSCKTTCIKLTGFCEECLDGYYKIPIYPGCDSCPDDCKKCESLSQCTECYAHRYGDTCELNCSETCQDQQCDIDGSCVCLPKYYGKQCAFECEGCTNNGCDDYNGNCIDHYCSDKFYDPRKCNESCGENCGDKGKCDLFTGECIACNGNNWGKNCEKKCSNECKSDGRVDCCYVKASKKARGINIPIIDNKIIKNNLKEEQSEFLFFNINLGGFDLKILADFETNSPLVIFDNSTEIKKTEPEIYNISIDSKYISSNSSYYIEVDALDGFFEYDGFSLSKEISAKDRLILNGHIFDNFSFLICQEYKIVKDFDNAGKINGIVGLGLRNYFTENLFYSNTTNNFPKNILIKSIDDNNKKSIYIGDYNEEIRRSFSRLSTMMIDNNKTIDMNKLITFETSFTGIAYSLRKAYQYEYDKKVILNNRIETTIVFNNLYRQFFEKIYFGDLFGNGCYFRSLQGGEVEYYCDLNKKQALQTLPKLGLILGNYIYYLSYDFLYKESGSFITFVIKLHGQSQQKIELGKSFFNEFSVIYNNGNETLNFFGDIKKLNVPLKDPESILNIDSDLITPGGWATISVSIIAVLIIICYLSKYCFNKNERDENEEEEDEDDDELLIDDALE